MSKKRTHYIPDKTEGELDQAVLYSVRNGNKRVFQQLEYVRKLNTAITLLVDESASMEGKNKIEGARKALVACGKQCSQMKTPFEILGYSTTTYGSPCYNRFKSVRGGISNDMFRIYNRFEPLHHTIYKEFHEDFNRVKYRLLQLRTHSDNSDSESLLWAANRLAVRPERRKILIIFSDGIPHVEMCSMDVMADELRKVVKKIMVAGIEVYGIGIYTDSVKRFYPNYSVIEEDRNNIAEAVFQVLSGKLITSAGY
jgi:cobaltochelatase CobT